MLTLVSSTEGAKINVTLFSSNFATELVIETTPWNIPIVVSFWQVPSKAKHRQEARVATADQLAMEDGCKMKQESGYWHTM
ncbi:hypothetical protein RHMOL_Rhmol08G0268500 [Rhododendron molle]|uniref:Uncharacterized protein n=1 Tax=Rhododendron molle TaxID=49168 RepID=A0ACC0MT57_RHOML|nr:hypothetical protein RHMOL_Rhmol08G0268500 [Rhododendron molle]